MRVLVAPDAVGSVSAVDVSAHLVQGWAAARPDDDVRVHPLGVGGRGLLDVVRTALGGSLEAVVAHDADGAPVPTAWLRVGSTAVIETATLLGDAEHPDGARRARDGSSLGVGEVLAAALRHGVRRVVLGVDRTATHDAGVGMLRALASASDDGTADPELPLDDVVRRVAGLLGRVEIVVAAGTDVPLVGLSGAGAALAQRPGLDADLAQQIEQRRAPDVARIERAAAARTATSLLAPTARPVRPSRAPSSGAGGGLAFALACVGARVLPGAEVIAVETMLRAAVEDAEVVLTACSSMDGAALAIGVPGVVGRTAAAALVPAVAVAPQVLLGRRELAGTGVEAVYPLQDPAGPGRPTPAALEPATALSQRASRVARTWSR